MTILDFSRGWLVSPAASDHPAAALAAAELHTLLERITAGHNMPPSDETEAGPPVQFMLTCDDEPGDGFYWLARPHTVELHGSSARGLLYAVYSFLEELGCRWPAPGTVGERLARGVEFELPDGPVVEEPGLPGRCLIIAHHVFMRQAADWIIWAARNRLNSIFFHTIDDSLPLGATPEGQYHRERDAALALARERGLTVELGGHVLASLLPRDRFAKQPELFRMAGGQRTPDHNLCVSNPDALDIVRRSAEAYFHAHPEADVYHIWPDDLAEGGWCECEQCRALTPSEQALIATNAVAEVLEAVNPAAQISFLAYHDTEPVPQRVQPHHNVCLLWAPRMRCYAHSTGDPACRVNTPRYSQTFRAQAAFFAAAGAAPPRVFEYYLDAVLFKSVLPPLPGVIQRDLRFYRDAGTHTVQALMTSDRPWIGAQLNAWLFARLAWDPDQDPDALIADFGAATFGMPADENAQAAAVLDIVTYYRSLEAAYGLALTLVPEEINLQISDDPLAVFRDPPVDMADPYFAPPAALHAKAIRQAVIPDLLAQATIHLDAIAQWANRDALLREQIEFALHDAWLRFDLARVQLYDAAANHTGQAAEYYEAARTMLGYVMDWGDRYLSDPRYQANFRFQHALFWQMRLGKTYAESAGPLRGSIIRARDALQVALLLRRMTGIYDMG